jgi:hypothetical protein
MIDGRESIRRIVTGELREVRERVEKSQPWTTEGRRSRQRLRTIFALLRRLARDSKNELIWQGVEELIGTREAGVPNLTEGGSIN